jgi:hypothetical protein
MTGERREPWGSEQYAVRRVAGANSAKQYRCPGCDQLIGVGVGHTVAWPTGDLNADERRHWHTGCCRARERRGPGTQRSRSAPRY